MRPDTDSMTTPVKAAANRCNALRSTGPKTAPGKIRSSQNALRHGLLSREAVLPGERRAKLTAFAERLHEDLAPEGELESLLVDRIVSCAWRLRRALSVEVGIIQRELSEDSEGKSEAEQLALAFVRAAYSADALTKLSRYETTLERGLFRALHELQRLQAARAGSHVVPPMAVDVEVSSHDPNP